MDSNVRLHHKLVCSVMLALACALSSNARAESEAYRRQARFEIERANDFHQFQKRLAEIERQRMSGVPEFKKRLAEFDKQTEIARRQYSEWRKREDAKRPTDEFVEQMLAQELKKEEREKEIARKEFKSVQMEVERAIANSRLNEAEEYGLDR